MKIKKGTQLKAVLCNHELEGSQDLVEAINRSTMAQVGCRRNKCKEEHCTGATRILLEVKTVKRGKKAGNIPVCPV